METVFGTLLLIIVIIWAFRLEIGVAKANEALARIEKALKTEVKEKK